MSERFVHSARFERLGEMLIPFITWLVITMPLWLSPFHPAVVAYLIIAFNLNFLYKSLVTAYSVTSAYRTIVNVQKISFDKKVQTIKGSEDINHFVIIPNYKEPIYKLEDTVNAIIKSDYPYKNIHLVLAFEKREEAEAEEKAQILKEKFGYFFKDILTSYHILESHEAPGKASNQTFAAKIVDKYCDDKKYDPKQVVITICDADSILPVNYFSYLTFEFMADKERDFHFYWAPVLLYNNFWQLPFFVRMQATLSSVLRIAFIWNNPDLIHVSTYSTNLWLLKKINFWDVDIIPEDWHVYFQAFFKFGDKVKTLPLFTIINGDAVYSGSVFKTLINRYEQEKRWAWGVTDFSYMWNNMFHSPHISWWSKIKKLLFLAEIHVLWPTSFFLLTVSASIPPLVNPQFKKTVLGFLLPQLSGIILTTATAMLIVYIYLDIKLRQRVNVETKLPNLPLLLIQWYLLPLVSFLFSSLPALDAHTRLLLGKKIIYKVTEKV